MTNIKTSTLPYDPGPAAWNCILPKPVSYGSLDETTTADVVIIGAGFAGLSAARRLLQIDPRLSVVILEARSVAEGPAGRNSGFMIDLPHNLASKDYSGDTSLDFEQTKMNRLAIDFAEVAASEFSMPQSTFVKSGKINAAATDNGRRHNVDYAAHLAAIGEDCDLLDAQQMKSICGTSYYRSGLYTPGTALLQPAQYIRSFAAGVTRSGAALYENSPVIGLARQGNVWFANTANGSVSAPHVVLATNGHVESFGYFKQRLMHIYLYASMTRPLSSRENAELGGDDEWAFTPADPMGTTVRKFSSAQGNRIIIRNRFTWSPDRFVDDKKLTSIARVHDRSFKNRFPMLPDIEMEYLWGGLLCLSRNAAPAYGELELGLFSACCQNGLGTAMGTLSGIAIADRMLQQNSPEDRFLSAQPDPQKLPPHALANIGANAYMRWGEHKAGAEL